MPTYLYWCEKHNEFEDFHSMSSIHKECPKCKEEGVEPGQFHQLINCTTKGSVELTGQEAVDKMRSDSKKLDKDIHSNEKLYASVLGEAKYEQMQKSMDRNRKERY